MLGMTRYKEAPLVGLGFKQPADSFAGDSNNNHPLCLAGDGRQKKICKSKNAKRLNACHQLQIIKIARS
jgi:hypothetical protein